MIKILSPIIKVKLKLIPIIFLIFSHHLYAEITQAQKKQVKDLNEQILKFYSKCKKLHIEMENPENKVMKDEEKKFACLTKFRKSMIPFDYSRVPLNNYSEIMLYWDNCTNAYIYDENKSSDFKDLCLDEFEKIKKLTEQLDRNLDIIGSVVQDRDSTKQKNNIQLANTYFKKRYIDFFLTCKHGLTHKKCEEEAILIKNFRDIVADYTKACEEKSIDSTKCSEDLKNNFKPWCDDFTLNEFARCGTKIINLTASLKSATNSFEDLKTKAQNLIKECKEYNLYPKKCELLSYSKLNQFIQNCQNNSADDNCVKELPNIKSISDIIEYKHKLINDAKQSHSPKEILQKKMNTLIQYCLGEKTAQCQVYSQLMIDTLSQANEYLKSCKAMPQIDGIDQTENDCTQQINKICTDQDRFYWTSEREIQKCKDDLETKTKEYNEFLDNPKNNGANQPQGNTTSKAPSSAAVTTSKQEPNCQENLHSAIKENIGKDQNRTFRGEIENTFKIVQDHALAKTGMLLSVAAKTMKEYIDEHKNERPTNDLFDLYKQIDIEKNITNNIQTYLTSSEHLNNIKLNSQAKEDLNNSMKDFFKTFLSSENVNDFIEPFLSAISKIKYEYELRKADGANSEKRNISLNTIDRQFLRTFLSDKEINSKDQFFDIIKKAILNQFDDPSKYAEIDTKRDNIYNEFKEKTATLKTKFFDFLKEDYFKKCFNKENISSTILYMASQFDDTNTGALSSFQAFCTQLSETPVDQIENFAQENFALLLKAYITPPLSQTCDNDYLDSAQNCKKCLSNLHKIEESCLACNDSNKKFPECTANNEKEKCDDNDLTGCPDENSKENEGLLDDTEEVCSTSDELIETNTCTNKMNDKQNYFPNNTYTDQPIQRQVFPNFTYAGSSVDLIGQIDPTFFMNG